MPTVDLEAADGVWRNTPRVIAAWVFGSAGDGVLREGSDLDIAVLFDGKPALDELLTLVAGLQDSLGMDEIDLVVLNGANPILRFEALSGRSLFCRDLEKRADFASLTAREYEDEMGMIRRALKIRSA